MDPRFEETIASIRTSKKEIFFQILLIFICPILLIEFKVIPIAWRVPVMAVLVFVLLAVLVKERWTASMLGFTWKNFRRSLKPYAIFTIIGIVTLILLAEKVAGMEELHRWWTHPHFLYMFFVVSLLQEVAYRGYLMPALGKLSDVHLHIVLVNAALFMFLHVIFPNPMMGLPLAALGGIAGAWMYSIYPNLPLAILSHSVLNFVAVLYGFYVIPGVTY